MGSNIPRKRIRVKESRILGLDLSLCSTGWCILNNGEPEAFGVIVTEKIKNKGMERLEYIRNEIEYLIKKNKCSINPNKNFLDLIVIEGYSMGSKGGRAFDIGELGGIVKRLCFKENIKTIIFPPKSLKKFITGNGNSDKAVMLKQTYKKYGFETENDDNNICDAFGLTKVGQAYLEGTKLEYEKQVLEKVEVLS